MDPLTSGIVAYKQDQTMSQVQFAVARKMLDNQQMQGDAAVKLINAACSNASQGGDALVAAATGLGGQVDTYA
jgi:Putative motility protein